GRGYAEEDAHVLPDEVPPKDEAHRSKGLLGSRFDVDEHGYVDGREAQLEDYQGALPRRLGEVVEAHQEVAQCEDQDEGALEVDAADLVLPRVGLRRWW